MFYLHNYRTCRGLPGVPSVSQPAARMAVVPATPEGVLEALDPEQRAVAEAVRGPVCVLAGAGTGKTRAITHRIAYGALTGAMPPQQVLAVTFTTRAASEMRSRLRLLGVAGVQAHTFHAAAWKVRAWTVGRPSPRSRVRISPAARAVNVTASTRSDR